MGTILEMDIVTAWFSHTKSCETFWNFKQWQKLAFLIYLKETRWKHKVERFKNKCWNSVIIKIMIFQWLTNRLVDFWDMHGRTTDYSPPRPIIAITIIIIITIFTIAIVFTIVVVVVVSSSSICCSSSIRRRGSSSSSSSSGSSSSNQ